MFELEKSSGAGPPGFGKSTRSSIIHGEQGLCHFVKLDLIRVAFVAVKNLAFGYRIQGAMDKVHIIIISYVTFTVINIVLEFLVFFNVTIKLVMLVFIL